MGEQDQVTLGEVYRLCQSIKLTVDQQNGRIGAVEKDLIRIKSFWTAGVFAMSIFGGSLKSKIGL